MSKQTFEAAMAGAGFNDSSTKISKTKLKAVMNEISDGIWGNTATIIGIVSLNGTIVMGDNFTVKKLSNPGGFQINHDISDYQYTVVACINSSTPGIAVVIEIVQYRTSIATSSLLSNDWKHIAFSFIIRKL